MRLYIPPRGSGLGDELALTAAVREARRENPREAIRIEESPRPDIWKHNPRINRGQTDNEQLITVDLKGFREARLVDVFARQLRICKVLDPTPEIWLTDEEILLDVGITDWDRTVAIDPSAGWSSRRWPIENFDLLSLLLAREGWHVLEVGKRETPRRVAGARDLTAFRTIRETASILGRCSLYVGNDSGLMHLAAAVGTPQVIVFGAVPWQHRAYWSTTPVFYETPCHENCTLSRRCNQTPRCLDEITPERVLAAVGAAERRFL